MWFPDGRNRQGGFTQNDDYDVDYINYECPSCGYKFCDI
ncbi:hypothetical protein ARM81ld_p53 [Aeromonas phage phiARM81ld]|nr:hypothetical protein ARM81ld_p53 [Aeromonas phage phiARM81ld]